uniref:Uncharacterized protein n=1 Tax=Mizuhopecten yessoensis TaxID=6573 RepID=Q75UP1_MIZYE|nr:hypothetical protein [Mizuhopecten yessoensis]
MKKVRFDDDKRRQRFIAVFLRNLLISSLRSLSVRSNMHSSHKKACSPRTLRQPSYRISTDSLYA